MAKSFREHSRTHWSPNDVLDNEYPGHDRVKIGCLQRIADATEVMAKDRQRLIDDYDYMRRNRDNYRALYNTERKRSAALKGVIAKMKKKIEELSQINSIHTK